LGRDAELAYPGGVPDGGIKPAARSPCYLVGIKNIQLFQIFIYDILSLPKTEVAKRGSGIKEVTSRLENNAGDVKLSTLHRIASGLNLQLNIGLSTVL